MSSGQVISEAGQKELLRIARSVLEAVARGEPAPDRPSELPDLQKPLGAFVTLQKEGELRGCIGTFVGDGPVWKVVAEMAESAAMSDPRFAPVRADELPDIDIEISILSPMRRTTNPLELELGVHGIYVKRGGRAGTFLPQVATEYHMTREEFLSTCCAHKAGLPPDAWKDPKTEVYLYTAQVFGEKEAGG